MSNGLLVVKREKVDLPLYLKKPHVDLTVKTLSSHKMKTSKATDLNLKNLGAEEALQKLFSFAQVVSVRETLVSDSYLFY